MAIGKDCRLFWLPPTRNTPKSSPQPSTKKNNMARTRESHGHALMTGPHPRLRVNAEFWVSIREQEMLLVPAYAKL